MKRVFELDLLSIALFRIVMGLVVGLDLLFRFPYWLDWYSDQGVLSRLTVMRYFMGEFHWSLHLSGGSAAFAYFMFVVHLGVVVAFTVGWRLRIASVLMWLLCYSLQNRNMLVLNGGDALMRLLLFWSMFLPLGDRLSIDSRWSYAAGPVFSVGTVAVVVQVLLVYWMSWLYKTGDSWRVHYDALWVSLANPELSTRFGAWLSQYKGFCVFLTWSFMAIELCGPLLLLSRWWLFRIAGIALLASIHIGSALTLTVGVFSFVSLAMLLLFLPSWFWGKVQDIDVNELRPRRNRYNIWSIAWNCFGAVALVYVLAYNASGYFDLGIKQVPGSLEFRNLGGLGQRWAMYAPDPPRNSYRLDVVADVDGPVYAMVHRPYGDSSRWRTYLARLRQSSYRPARQGYVDYVQEQVILPVSKAELVLETSNVRSNASSSRSLGVYRLKGSDVVVADKTR